MSIVELANEVLTVRRSMGIASMAVGVVFAYAAVSKLFDFRNFVVGIQGFHVIPNRFATTAAGLLVVGESLVAVSHLAGVGLHFVVPGTVLLLSAFFVTMANSLWRGEKRTCLCFGARQDDVVDIYSLARVTLLFTIEMALVSFLLIKKDTIFTGTGDLFSDLISIVIAVLAVFLTGWCLALPKIYRAWSVVR